MLATLTVLVVSGVIALGLAVRVASKRKRLAAGGSPKLLTEGSSTDLLERGFSDMRVGDIVSRLGTDYLVEGVVGYDESGHRWTMANLVDGRTQYWLLVGLERSGIGTKRLLQNHKGLELGEYPPEVLVIEGKSFRFDKRGTATTTIYGEVQGLGGTATDLGGAHRCRWWSYECGLQTLIVEQWGKDYRVLIGDQLGDTDVELLPAS